MLTDSDLTPSYAVKNDMDDPVVKRALKLIAMNFTEKNARDIKNELISSVYDQGFTVYNPRTYQAISCKKIIQAILSVVAKSKPHEFTMHGTQAKQFEESLVTQGFTSVLENAGYVQTFRDKGGFLYNSLMYGDGFRMVGVDESDDVFPIRFKNIANSNVYVDSSATSMRDGTKPVREVALVFSGDFEEFMSLYPKAKRKRVGTGRIPRNNEFVAETDQTYWQSLGEGQKPVMEWCFYYNIDRNEYAFFAGSSCTIMDKKTGEDYPYIYKDNTMRDRAYVPVSQRICMPAAKGFFNHGIAEYVFDLAMLYQSVFNKYGTNVDNNVSPFALVNVPQGEDAKFFRKLQMANQERALGRTAFIPIENGNSGNGVSIQPFFTQPLSQEATILWDRIDLELRRIGIYLDELETGTNTTATEILANIDQQTSFVRQISEYNASEALFELQVVKDLTKKVFKKTDKTPLNLTTIEKVEVEGQMVDVKADFMTMGLLKTALTERHWFIRVNDKSGVIYSPTARRAELMQIFPYLQPGTPEYQESLSLMAKLNNVDIMQPTPNMNQAPVPQNAGGMAGAGSLTGSPSTQGGFEQPPREIANDEVRFRSLSQI